MAAIIESAPDLGRSSAWSFDSVGNPADERHLRARCWRRRSARDLYIESVRDHGHPMSD
jgi:hypothetical protein